MNFKAFFTNVRIMILLAALIFSLIAINPQPWNDGAAIRSVDKESAAALASIPAPTAKIQPVARERVIAINNEPIMDEADYHRAASAITALGPNMTFTLRTNKNFYTLRTKASYEIIALPEIETVEVVTPVYNATTNETVNVTTVETRNKTEQRYIGVEDIGLTVYDAPKSNIREGLELSGGTRVILQPEEPVESQDLDLIVSNIKERLNVFGLSDLIVRTATDLSGNDFIVVEIAGANQDEVRQLLSEQGKFEARIGNETVFFGGDKDVTYVCRSADCSGIDPQVGCGPSAEGISCRFRFSISLSPAAAQRQADVTSKLGIEIGGTGGSYLSQPLDLYLDDVLVDSLQIGSDLKGRATTNIQISGSGVGPNQQEAITDSLASMKKLQTVLITGSLPVKLNIVKIDSISPVLGHEFVTNALLIGLLAIIAVVLFVFVAYRDLRVALPMALTMLSEAIIILGFASLVGWNLDLAAIAAIIIAIGTGVDDQIVIADETRKKDDDDEHLTWAEKVKRALFIIMAAYVTTVAAMVPLWFAGAGMLRGFAITTIVGVSIGVFITRPAFAAVIEFLTNEEKE